MSWVYTKMHGAGNTFVVVEDLAGKFEGGNGALVRAICDADAGVGSDGLLLVQRSEDADVRMRFYNPDGCEVAMCGNGARCLAWLAVNAGLAGERLRMETGAGVLTAEVRGEWVRLEMGAWQSECLDVELACGWRMDLLNTGVAHAVHWVRSVKELELLEWERMGSLIRWDDYFQPEGTNASAAVVDEQGVLSIRTFERGVEGETLACGTGALAAARLAVVRGACSFPVEVRCRSGEKLMVDDVEGCMVLSGRAVKMEEGVWSGGDRV